MLGVCMRRHICAHSKTFKGSAAPISPVARTYIKCFGLRGLDVLQREDADARARRAEAVAARKASAEACLGRRIAEEDTRQQRTEAANLERSALSARRHAERAHLQERLAGTFSASTSPIFQTST